MSQTSPPVVCGPPEALTDLADASEALLNASVQAEPTARESRAGADGDLVRWDDERFRRMMFVCGHSHDAVRAALAAYSRGVEQVRPARGPGGDRVASAIEGLTRPAREQFVAAIKPSSPSFLLLWSDPGVCIRSRETLQHLTPQAAADAYAAACRCCRIAVAAVTARHGHAAWTRDLMELLDDNAALDALRRQTRSARFARKTYTRRCLAPPADAPDLPDTAALAPAPGTRRHHGMPKRRHAQRV